MQTFWGYVEVAECHDFVVTGVNMATYRPLFRSAEAVTVLGIEEGNDAQGESVPGQALEGGVGSPSICHFLTFCHLNWAKGLNKPLYRRVLPEAEGNMSGSFA